MISTITKHGLDKIDSSPLDYWFHYINPDKPDYTPSEKTLFDNALRLSVFNFDKFKFLYMVVPKIDKRSAIGKSEFASLVSLSEKSGKILIEKQDYNKIILMREEILKHQTAKNLCLEDRQNVTSEYHEKQSGVVIKFKPHFVNPIGVIVNLSSSKDISLHNFQKECWDFRNDKKAAIQMDGSGIDSMVFVTIEDEPPFKITVRYLDDRSVNLGRETYLRNCETYAECMESGIWIGPESKIVECSLPEWAFNR